LSPRFLALLSLCAALALVLAAPIGAQTLKWEHTWGYTGDDFAYGVDVDDTGIYMAGSTLGIPNGFGDDDAFIAKWDEDGNLLWDRVWGGADHDEARSVKVYGGYVYVVGTTYSFGSGGDIFLAVFKPTGELVWDLAWGTSELEEGVDIAFYNDYAYVVARGNTPTGLSTALLTKIKLSTQSIEWIRRVSSSTANLIPTSIDVGDPGVYVSDDGGDFVFMLKHDGSLGWATKWSGGAGHVESLCLMDGYLYVLDGEFVLKLSEDGTTIAWAKAVEIVGSFYPHLRDIYCNDGDLYMTGSVHGYFISDDVVAFKLTSDGDFKWGVVWGGDGNEYGYGIVKSGHQVYVVGSTSWQMRNSEIVDAKLHSYTLDPSSYSVTLQSVSEYASTSPNVQVKDPNANIDNVNNNEAFILKLKEPPDVYAFVRGMNNKIYRNMYYLNPSWEVWTQLPSGATPSGVAVARHGGKIYLAVRGMNDKIYYGELDELTEEFSGWTYVGGSTPSKPAIAIDPDAGYLWIVVRGMNDRIYIKGRDLSSGTWTAWEKLPGSTSEAPAATAHANQLFIAVKGSEDNSIWFGAYDESSRTFSGWNKVSGATPSAPDLAVDSSGNVYLAVRGTNNKIYINKYDGTNWLGWEQVPTGTTAQGPAIAFDLDGNLHVMVTSSSGDGSIYHCYKDVATGTWTPWSKLSGKTPSEPDLT